MKKMYSDFAKTIGTDNDTIIVGLEEDSKLSNRNRHSIYYILWGRIERPFTCVTNGEINVKRKTISEIFMGCGINSWCYDNKIKEMRKALGEKMLEGFGEIPKAHKRLLERDNIEFCKWFNYNA